MPLALDHTHSFEGSNESKNGGIGAYSDTNHLLPFLSKKEYDASVGIMKETISARFFCLCMLSRPPKNI